MDRQLSAAERAMRAARGMWSPADFAAARAAWIVAHLRAGGRDPRVDPLEDDVVQEAPVVAEEGLERAGVIRAVHRASAVPRSQDLVKIELDDVLVLAVKRGWKIEHNGEWLHIAPPPPLVRGASLQIIASRPQRGRDVLRALEALALGDEAVIVELRGPWVDWRAALNVDEMAIVREVRSARRYERRSRRRTHEEGRCTLRSWRAWAKGGTVLRFAEELGKSSRTGT